jgi:AcrR family transcriptional regulator
MGLEERRSRERQRVRTAILRTARAVFSAEGADAVTMRRIAAAIEYSPAALYAHFRDKDALLAELCSQDFRALASRFARLLRLQDPVARLRRAGHAYIDFALAHPHHYRLRFMRPGERDWSSTGGDPEQDAYAFFASACAAIIAAGRARPGLADAHLLAQTFWSGVHGVASLQLALGKDQWVRWRAIAPRRRLMVDALVEAITRG